MEDEKLLAQSVLLLSAINAELKRLNQLLSGHPVTAEGWAAPSIAWQALKSEGVKSQKHLKQLRLEGVFSEAKGEIRNLSTGTRPTWEYHIPKCRNALQRHFKRRSGA